VCSSDLNLTLNKVQKTWIEQNPEVEYTGDPNWLPFEAFDKNGKYIGIVSDHLKLVEQRTGLKFRHRVVKSWTESLQVATEGQVAVISGDVADKTLTQTFRLIAPYLINPLIIIMAKQSKLCRGPQCTQRPEGRHHQRLRLYL